MDTINIHTVERILVWTEIYLKITISWHISLKYTGTTKVGENKPYLSQKLLEQCMLF